MAYGKALVMITEWEETRALTSEETEHWFSAEIYPFGGEIIAKDKSLAHLLERLAKKTNIAKIPRLK